MTEEVKILRDGLGVVAHDLKDAKFDDFDKQGFDCWAGLILVEISSVIKEADKVKG